MFYVPIGKSTFRLFWISWGIWDLFFSHGPVNEARRCGPMLRRSSSGETGSLPLRLKVVMACHGYGVRYRQVFSHNMTSRFRRFRRFSLDISVSKPMDSLMNSPFKFGVAILGVVSPTKDVACPPMFRYALS